MHDDLASATTDALKRIGDILADYRDDERAVRVERIYYDILDRWRAHSRSPSEETRRRLKEMLAIWRYLEDV